MKALVLLAFLISAQLFTANPVLAAHFVIEKQAYNDRATFKNQAYEEFESKDRSYAFQRSLSQEPLALTTESTFKNATVSVAQPIYANGQLLGYGRDRKNLESVAEYMLRQLILHINHKNLTEVLFDRNLDEASKEKNQLKIFRAIQEIRQSHLPANSFNTFVRYKDAHKTEIAEIVYELPISKQAAEAPPKDIPAMIGEIAQEISRTLKSGHYPLKTISYRDVQKNHQNILRPNMAGRNVRVAGVDQNYEDFILKNVQQDLAKKGFELVEAYYFGSRVMTRVELLKIEPAMSENLSLKKGQIPKNVVREGGLTNTSDLELFLVVKPLSTQPDIALDILDEFQLDLRDQIRAELNKISREYSLGMKVLVVKKDSQAKEHFTAIQHELVTKKNWLSSPEQYSRFYPRPLNSFQCRSIHM